MAKRLRERWNCYIITLTNLQKKDTIKEVLKIKIWRSNRFDMEKNKYCKTYRKIGFLFMAAVISAAGIKCQEVKADTKLELSVANFPDENLRKYISEKYDVDKDNVLSTAEQEKITALVIPKQGLKSLEGVEKLCSLERLVCSGNSLSSLSLSSTSLTYLDVLGNQMTSLDMTGCKNLEILRCSNNQLTDLNLEGLARLTFVECKNNQLTNINLSECSGLERFVALFVL